MSNYRYIASVLIEASTALRVGGSKADLITDSPVLRDYNGLPFIPGSSIAGVLRKHYRTMKLPDEEKLFGFQKGEDGFGSRVIVSNAHLVDESGKVIEELQLERSDYMKIFDMLPVRNHVRIGHKGVAEEHGKFDEEICYKGTRWRFEIELIADDSDDGVWNRLIGLLSLPTFRLGSGGSRGFGKLKIVSIHTAKLRIDDEQYIKKSASLNDVVGDEITLNSEWNEQVIHYELNLKPDDFFMFGSGIGDEDADMIPVTEQVIVWQEMKNPKLSEEQILIPASSIKGALSHRTAFYYNQIKERFAEEYYGAKANQIIGENSEAVAEIFGSAKGDEAKGHKGRILLSDLFAPKNDEKVFDHVRIDRFRGGASDGALFQEKTFYSNDEWKFEILIENLNAIDQEYLNAFEKALKDVTSGMLPLGGLVNHGHGVFRGSVTKNGEELRSEA